MKGRKDKKVIKCLIILILFSMLIYLGIEEYREIQIKKKTIFDKEYNTQNLSSDDQESGNHENEVKVYPKEEIETQYKGYQVIAKLEIPEIRLITYVLERYSKEALNVSVTKFWGADPNQIGNFCIAGHNFQNKNMFHHLKKLEIGNQLFISDHSIGKVEYEVSEIYVVEPEDVSCLSQETNQKREVTLITCTNDSKKRIIVKAQEVK